MDGIQVKLLFALAAAVFLALFVLTLWKCKACRKCGKKPTLSIQTADCDEEESLLDSTAEDGLKVRYNRYGSPHRPTKLDSSAAAQGELGGSNIMAISALSPSDFQKLQDRSENKVQQQWERRTTSGDPLNNQNHRRFLFNPTSS